MAGCGFHLIGHVHRAVNVTETVKSSRGLDPKIEAVFRDLLGRIPFLQVKSFRAINEVYGNQPDALVEVEARGKPWVLVVECKRQGHPQYVRHGLLQLQRFLEPTRGRPCYGVLVAPFISKLSADLCAEAGVGYVDFAGNARLAFDQVFIETRVADNPFREKRETRSLFGPRATRVLRVLLQGPLHPWRVAELAESARVSVGWASAVRRELLAREWGVEEPGGLRVKKPHAILDAWVKADDWRKRTTTEEYSLLLPSDPVHLAEKLQDTLKGDRPAFTQWFAAWLRHPHATVSVVTAYVRKLPEETVITEAFLARQVSSGGRLRLVLPKDEGVFSPAQKARGFDLVSDVQIYLDLLPAGLRGDEQAAELRKWPDFAGGWA